MSKLVIVESPAKAKTIKKYLGEDYNVIASMGHVRDLPKAQIGIDIDNNFKPRYINIPGKSKLIKQIKEAARESDAVYLATDPDREGEAISWHLAHILKLDEKEKNRVTFGEITKKGISDGMANIRSIDMDLINAQQARRILDRIVGYKLSPFLWRKVKGGLSAGRVQSVAVKLIVDRHREIERFVPSEYWNIDAVLSPGSSAKKFRARYYGTDGKKRTVEKIKHKSGKSLNAYSLTPNNSVENKDINLNNGGALCRKVTLFKMLSFNKILFASAASSNQRERQSKNLNETTKSANIKIII